MAAQATRAPSPTLWLVAAAALFSPAPSHAAGLDALLLTQDGIGVYETLSSAVSAKLGARVAVQSLDALSEPGDLQRVLAEKSPRVIIVIGTAAARAVASAKLGLPVIFCLVPRRDLAPLEGIAATGVLVEVPFAAQLAGISAVLPNARRLGVFYNPKLSQDLVVEARRAAGEAGLSLVETPVDGPAELANALKGLSGRIDAVWMVQDRSLGTALAFKILLVTTLELRLPLMAYSASYVESGAMLSLAPDYAMTASHTVELVENVLRGTAVKSLIWQQPPAQLVINMKAAAQLGVEVPAAVRARARLIE